MAGIGNIENLAKGLQDLKIVERDTPKAELPSDTSTGAVASGAGNEKQPTVIIILGMAGSGKTTLTGKMISYLQSQGSYPYVMNLDPACLDPPYGVNIDIRDTIDYKQVMKSHRLGPNGAIVTSINLFSTKFDTVLDILKQRAANSPYIIVDTPGQLEVFMWSASGTIMTEVLAANFPTIMLYVTDLANTKTPISFVSNMTYACSVLYKSKLPLVLALNKCDLQGADEIIRWITDFEVFQAELGKYEGQSVNLASSLSLVLDDFYSVIKHQPVSAVTGEGISAMLKLVDASKEEYYRDFRANYEKLVEDKKEEKTAKKTKKKKASENAFAFSESGTESSALGFTLSLGSSSEGEVSEEEDPHAKDNDELPLGGTIRDYYQQEAERKTKKAEQMQAKSSQ